MKHPALLACLLLLGLWRAAQGAVLAGPGHHALTSWRFDGDAVRRRCLERSVTNVTCSDVGDDRLLPHPDDCELFYYCVGRVTICRQCPAGLHFSPTTHVCDRPEDAGCAPPPNTTEKSSSSSHTASEENSTTSLTSPSTLPAKTSTYPTTLPSSTPTHNVSSTTQSPNTNTTSEPSESTTRDSMTTFIKLH